MARSIIERIETLHGVLALIQDPHDGPGKDRWFVEAWTQLRFVDEHQARLRFNALRSPTPENCRDPWHGDIGQVDTSPYRAELRVQARGEGGERWTLVVKPWWAGAQLSLDDRIVPLSSYTSVVAYMLMRAICRGIAETEVREGGNVVVIDMGTIPGPSPRLVDPPF